MCSLLNGEGRGVLPWMFHKAANTVFGRLKASPYPVGCACLQWWCQWKGEKHEGSWFLFLPGFRGFLLNYIQKLHFTASVWSTLLWANPFQLCGDIITLTFPKKRTSIDPRGQQHLLLSKGVCSSSECRAAASQHLAQAPQLHFRAAPILN